MAILFLAIPLFSFAAVGQQNGIVVFGAVPKDGLLCFDENETSKNGVNDKSAMPVSKTAYIDWSSKAREQHMPMTSQEMDPDYLKSVQSQISERSEMTFKTFQFPLEASIGLNYYYFFGSQGFQEIHPSKLIGEVGYGYATGSSSDLKAKTFRGYIGAPLIMQGDITGDCGFVLYSVKPLKIQISSVETESVPDGERQIVHRLGGELWRVPPSAGHFAMGYLADIDKQLYFFTVPSSMGNIHTLYKVSGDDLTLIDTSDCVFDEE